MTFGNDDDDDDDDVSILEYARSQGLSLNYLDCRHPSHETWAQLGVNQTERFHNTFPDIQKYIDVKVLQRREILEANGSAVRILQELANAEVHDEDLSSLQRFRRLRFSPPLLGSDVKIDQARFEHHLKVDTATADITTNLRQLNKLQLPQDSAYTWPLDNPTISTTIASPVENEILQSTEHDLVLIQELSQVPDDLDIDGYWHRSSAKPRNSPPLQSLTAIACPERDNDISCSTTVHDINCNDATNDQTNEISQDEIEKVCLPIPLDLQSSSLSSSSLDPSSSIPPRKRRSSEVRSEAASEYQNAPKKVKLYESVKSEDTYANREFDQSDGDDLIKVDENTPINSSTRLEMLRVPITTFVNWEIKAPWETTSKTNKTLVEPSSMEYASQRELLNKVFATINISESPILTVNSLSWTPFPCRKHIISLEEQVENVSNHYMNFLLEYNIDYDSFSWKLPGLRILDDNGDDEDLLPSTPSLPKVIEPNVVQDDLMDLINQQAMTSNHITASSGPFQIIGDSRMSITNPMNQFLQVQNGILPKPPIISPTVQPIKDQPLSPKLTSSSTAQFPVPQSLSQSIQALCSPDDEPVHTSSTPSQIIISTTILERKELFQSLKDMLPTTTKMIERDYSSSSPSSKRQEADIIPSINTGIILTTLQKVKQLSLPTNDPDPRFRYNAIQNRVLDLRNKYANVIILVSQARMSNSSTPNEMELDGTSSASLDNLRRLGSDGNTNGRVNRVEYVSGCERDFARRILNVICQDGSENQSDGPYKVDLWDEDGETEVEIQLREKGLNGYVALSIVSILQERGVLNGQIWDTLLDMNDDERNDTFGKSISLMIRSILSTKKQ